MIGSLKIIPKILIYWYITIFLSTEFFSYFNLIGRNWIVTVNIVFLIGVFIFYKNKLSVLIKELLQKRSRYAYVIYLILLLTFLQGFFSAPNTTDSMVYHLPRMMYWIQEQTLYQDVIRNDHDFMAPFAEYILLHIYLIFNGDRMLFISQWLAFLVTIVLCYLVAKQLDVEDKIARLVTLLVASLPIAVMQATSTQTDMIVAVTILLSVYFAFLFRKNPNLKNSLLVGFSIGLGFLTKAPFVFYVIMPFSLIITAIFKEKRQYIIYLLIAVLTIVIVQTRFISQNLHLYGNVAGQKLQGGGFINELINGQVILSNLIRNIFLHIPVPIATNLVQGSIVYLHERIGLDLNDSRTTYFDTKFSVLPVIFPQEDIAGNPIQLALIFLTLIVLIGRFNKLKVWDLKIFIFFLVIISFVMFSTVLKWQPFHSRLQIPFFIIGSIAAIPILFQHKKLNRLLNYLVTISVTLAVVLIFLNVSKPFISYSYFYSYVKSFAPPLADVPQAFYIEPRDQQYFHARFYWYMPYKDIIEKLSEQKIEKGTITFKLMDGFEYPLWLFIKEKNLNFRVLPESKASKDTVILSTSENPFHLEEYKTDCVKTQINYGFACISRAR